MLVGGDIPCDLEGGGGGGGVGFVGIGATNTVSQTGVRSGDGIVTLAYHDVPALSATNTVLSGPTSGKAGRPRVFKVAVSVMQNGTASGSVSLYDGSTVVATATLAKGKAKLSATFAKGVHTLVAYYGGDATRAPSTSATLSITIK